MKTVSYKQETGDKERLYILEPHRVLLSFNSGNWVTMALATSC